MTTLERGVRAKEPSVLEGKYSVELFKEGGEGAGTEEIVDRHDNQSNGRPSDLSRSGIPVSGAACHALPQGALLSDKAVIAKIIGIAAAGAVIARGHRADSAARPGNGSIRLHATT